MKSYKTTEKHFEKFKKYVRKWVEVFGEKGWAIEFELILSSRVKARVEYNSIGRWADIKLSKIWVAKPTNALLEEVAMEEVLHLTLSRLTSFEQSDQEIEDEHEVIKKILNAIE